MTFRFDYDPLECFRAVRLAQRRRRRAPRWLVAVPCVAAVGWLVAEPEGATVTGAILPTISWIAVLLFLAYGLAPLVTLNAAYRVRRRNPAMTTSCTLTHSGLEVRTQGASADLAWSYFERGLETRELFVLLPHLGGLHYLPKRALAGEADVRTARALLATHLGRQFEPLAEA